MGKKFSYFYCCDYYYLFVREERKKETRKPLRYIHPGSLLRAQRRKVLNALWGFNLNFLINKFSQFASAVKV